MAESINGVLLPPHYQPSPNTVIVGRGKEPKQNLGNKRLRVIVSQFLEQYQQGDKKQKSQIVTDIIYMVRNSCNKDFMINNGVGAFVKHIKKTDKWYDLDNGVAREKVGYVFRDLLADHYKSSSKSKVEARMKQLEDKSVASGGSSSVATTTGSVVTANTQLNQQQNIQNLKQQEPEIPPPIPPPGRNNTQSEMERNVSNASTIHSQQSQPHPQDQSLEEQQNISPLTQTPTVVSQDTKNFKPAPTLPFETFRDKTTEESDEDSDKDDDRSLEEYFEVDDHEYYCPPPLNRSTSHTFCSHPPATVTVPKGVCSMIYFDKKKQRKKRTSKRRSSSMRPIQEESMSSVTRDSNRRNSNNATNKVVPEKQESFNSMDSLSFIDDNMFDLNFDEELPPPRISSTVQSGTINDHPKDNNHNGNNSSSGLFSSMDSLMKLPFFGQ